MPVSIQSVTLLYLFDAIFSQNTHIVFIWYKCVKFTTEIFKMQALKRE